MPCYHKPLSALLAALLCLPSEKSAFGGLSFLVVVFFCSSPLPCWRMVGTGQVWPWCKCLSFARQGSADPGFVQLSGQHSLHTGGRRLRGISVPWLIVPSCYSQAVPLAIGHAVKRPSKNRPTRNPNAQWIISAGFHTSVIPYTAIFSCLGCIGDRVWREDAGSVQG